MNISKSHQLFLRIICPCPFVQTHSTEVMRPIPIYERSPVKSINIKQYIKIVCYNSVWPPTKRDSTNTRYLYSNPRHYGVCRYYKPAAFSMIKVYNNFVILIQQLGRSFGINLYRNFDGYVIVVRDAGGVGTGYNRHLKFLVNDCLELFIHI